MIEEKMAIQKENLSKEKIRIAVFLILNQDIKTNLKVIQVNIEIKKDVIINLKIECKLLYLYFCKF